MPNAFSVLSPEDQQTVLSHMARNYKGTHPQQLVGLLQDNDMVAEQAVQFAGLQPQKSGDDRRHVIDWAANAGLVRGQDEEEVDEPSAPAATKKSDMGGERRQQQSSAKPKSESYTPFTPNSGPNVDVKRGGNSGTRLGNAADNISEDGAGPVADVEDDDNLLPYLVGLLGARSISGVQAMGRGSGGANNGMNGDVIPPNRMPVPVGGRASMGMTIDGTANQVATRPGSDPAIMERMMMEMMQSGDMGYRQGLDGAIITEPPANIRQLPAPEGYVQPFPSGAMQYMGDNLTPEDEARAKGNIATNLGSKSMTYQDIIRMIARSVH